MKILFICGCLEPGRDAVGDYVRQLSEELVRQGHDPFALALSDPYVNSLSSTTQAPDKKILSAVRLPADWKPSRRLEQAKLWTDIVDPDVLSVQYRPLSFDVKGLPLLLGQDIKHLAKTRKVHMMLHGTWADTGRSASIKQKLHALAQQQILKRSLNMIRPVLIHSNLPVYLNQVKALGFKARPLPLFSNIPFPNEKVISDDAVFRIGLFSPAEPGEELVDFLKSIISEVNALGIRTSMVLIGGDEAEMGTYKEEYERIPGLEGQVLLTGPLQVREISALIQTCSMGITSVALHSLGNSGSVAAFLSHGVPVAAPVIHPGLAIQDIGLPSAALSHAILVKPTYESFVEARDAALAAGQELSVSAVAASFITDLQGL